MKARSIQFAIVSKWEQQHQPKYTLNLNLKQNTYTFTYTTYKYVYVLFIYLFIGAQSFSLVGIFFVF